MNAVAKWGSRIKLTFGIAVGSFVVMFLLVAIFGENFGGLIDTIFSILALLFLFSCIAIPFLVLMDARAIKRSENKWSPRGWLWFIGTFLLYGLPFLVYMYLRRRRVEQRSTSLPSVDPSSSLSTDSVRLQSTPMPSVPEGRTEKDRNLWGRFDWDFLKTLGAQVAQANSEPSVSTLRENGDEHLTRAEALLNVEEYIEAKDAYEGALSLYKGMDERGSGSKNIALKVQRAEEGIERCWLRPLTEKVDRAEQLLDSGEKEEAGSHFQQVAEALESRTFHYCDSTGLLHRVGKGLKDSDAEM